MDLGPIFGVEFEFGDLGLSLSGFDQGCFKLKFSAIGLNQVVTGILIFGVSIFCFLRNS